MFAVIKKDEMKPFITFCIFAFLTSIGHSQTGTIGNPFPTLNYAVTVTSAGNYYFNIGGTTFDTYVDASGYVLIAIDFGNGTGNLPQVSSLNLTGRGILNTSTLASITSQTELRISSSSGAIDVTNSNATLLARISSNTTLHTGTADNTINNTWAGTGSTNLTNDATGVSPTANSLHRKIFHPSGNSTTLHWQPRINQQRESHGAGEIGNTESLMLWVRDNSSPLPIELLNFNVNSNKFGAIETKWQTASENNNDYFTIERSVNGYIWEEIGIIEGAGNSAVLLDYSFDDRNPYLGISYYRLKQTDFDGQFEYSKIKSVDFKLPPTLDVSIYPNPTINEINIQGTIAELEQFKIYNCIGQNVTHLVIISYDIKENLVIDLSQLRSGIYFINTKTTTNKVIKN